MPARGAAAACQATVVWRGRVVAGGIDARAEPARTLMCGASGTSGGASGNSLRAAFCRAQLWRFNSLRPANHPQRRLALAAHWLAAGDLPAKLEKWFTETVPDDALAESLLEVLQVERDDFWSWHWTFRSARMSKPQPMLGAARVTDLAVNVILPWFWMRAVEGKNEKLQRVAEQRYYQWPAAEDNSVLRLARQRLLGGAKAAVLKGAAAQQGLLQILRDFCEHSNALCEHCQFPELVRNWSLK